MPPWHTLGPLQNGQHPLPCIVDAVAGGNRLCDRLLLHVLVALGTMLVVALSHGRGGWVVLSGVVWHRNVRGTCAGSLTLTLTLTLTPATRQPLWCGPRHAGGICGNTTTTTTTTVAATTTAAAVVLSD